jgi:hypothetical protein
MLLLPIGSITSYLRGFGEIKKEVPFSYNPLNISKLESLNIETDIGNIDIEYVYPNSSLDYGIRIDVKIDLAGKGLVNKTYEDIINISYSYDESSVNFSINIQPKFSQEELKSLMKVFDIVVKINADTRLDIRVDTGFGNVEINVPFATKISNLYVNTTEGNIFCDFIDCYVNGKINSFSNLGDLSINLVNVRYSQNTELALSNSEGLINLNLAHDKVMGTNLTGFVRTRNGEIQVNYKDTISEMGAVFTFYNHTTGWVGIDNSWSGFYDPVVSGIAQYDFTSFDYPSSNNYNLSFYKSLVSGGYSVNLSSI